LGASGVENGAKVKATIWSRPTLFSGLPVSKTIAKVSNDGHDHVGSDDEQEESSDESSDDDVNPPPDISKAPKVASEVAKAMMAAAPTSVALILWAVTKVLGTPLVLASQGVRR